MNMPLFKRLNFLRYAPSAMPIEFGGDVCIIRAQYLALSGSLKNLGYNYLI
ncbi:hypothetical protein GCWU000324_00565 [Kingella oralis ATCC 51147]|uniref:Uncharacterized protein n=1 Tax=Kingella oralis ATCC 51147 TaxID=629741 RepID=C4GI74_9NEIS|nr:hypothetical protein GCWU000324_00565 [Kingella oralis ATCC 51147]